MPNANPTCQVTAHRCLPQRPAAAAARVAPQYSPVGLQDRKTCKKEGNQFSTWGQDTLTDGPAQCCKKTRPTPQTAAIAGRWPPMTLTAFCTCSHSMTAAEARAGMHSGMQFLTMNIILSRDHQAARTWKNKHLRCFDPR